jgi:SulP family sulfate permease
MNKFKPMLFSNMKQYTKEQFFKDLISGIIVAIIALPLSIALALASGVGPEQGIYTAIVAGFLISFLGGSRVQIAGPTAAFATIVAGIVAEQGMDGLVIATIMAGIILIIMGICRFGTLIKFIPYTITTGFTAGIAVTILIGQWKDFFGVTYQNGEKPIETMEKLEAFFKNINTFNWQAALVGVICLAILIAWPYIPKIGKVIPGSLIAVFAGIALVKGVGLHANTIGDLYTINSGLPTFSVPSFSFAKIRALLPDAFTIAVLAAIESLLSCVVADGMINSHHRSNMELIAQGVGNVGSALFGGIPATGAIARTAANIKSGGRTPVAGMVHSLVLLLVLVVLMPYAALIPMPTIAAILFLVAYNMCQWRPFVKLCKTAPKSDVTVLVLTFILTIVFDLVVAIEVGMIVACLLFMKRMSDETDVKSWKYVEDSEDPDSINIREVPLQVRVYEISGPLFFGAAGRLADISVKEFTKVLVIRMRAVPALDATAMNSLNALCDTCEKKGIRLVFSHVNEQPMKIMEKSNFVERVGRENFCVHIDDALERAKQLVEMAENV